MPLKVLGARLCTPAITNGDGNTGLNYLEQFVGECEGCSFDIINIHHYVQRSDLSVDQAVATVKTYIETKLAAVQEKHAQLKGLKIFLGEVCIHSFSNCNGGEWIILTSYTVLALGCF